jgi:hypothetical protein
MPQRDPVVDEAAGRLAANILKIERIVEDNHVSGDEVRELVQVARGLRLVLVIVESLAKLHAILLYAIRVGPDAVLNKPHLRSIREIGPTWRQVRVKLFLRRALKGGGLQRRVTSSGGQDRDGVRR